MRKYFKRTICFCLAALMLLSVLPAYAEGFETNTKVYIIDNILNAYKTKSTSSKVLGVMTYGESMTMLSFDGDWVKIKNAKGQIGYCKLTGLSTQNPSNLNETVYARANKTPVYQKASTSYKKIASVKQNYKFNVIAMTPDGDWLRVKNGSRYGFVRVDDVNREPVSVHGALVAKTVYVVSENASVVYSGKGGGKNMGNISHGQSYTLLGTDGKYSRIRNGKGQVGWCLSELLSTENPNNMNATMYAQVGGGMLYTNSIFKGTPKKLNKDAKVTVVAKTPEGGWYRVKHGNKYYYVPSILLDDEKAPSSGREVYTKTDTPIYAKASYSARKTGTISAYEELTLIGLSKQGAKVRTTFGTTGYLPIGLLEPSVWTFAVNWR